MMQAIGTLYLEKFHSKKRRVDWCSDHAADDWSKTIFTDDTTFQLYRNTVLVWVLAAVEQVDPLSRHGLKIYAKGKIGSRVTTVLKTFKIEN